MNKRECLEKLEDYVLNMNNCNNQLLSNTIDTINEYLNQLNNLVTNFKANERNYIDKLKQITELSTKLRILFELKILYASDISTTSHVRKELEVLKDDTK